MNALTENYQLKWHSFKAHLHGCVANYLNSDIFADVALFTSDGHKLHAHRFVLSSCSQYFHQVFKYQQKLTSLPVTVVLPPEISYKTLKVLTQYMYTGEATVSKEILDKVLRGGELLKVQGLWRPTDQQDHTEKQLLHMQNPRPLEDTSKPSKIASSATKVHGEKTVVKTTDKCKKNNDDNTNKAESKPVARQDKQTEKRLEKKLGDVDKENFNSHTDESSTSAKRKKLSEVENGESLASSSTESLVFVIKEEPLEWSEVNESDMEMIHGADMFHTEMTIKPEVVLDDRCEEEFAEEGVYSPLTCELCSETFALPADWVKHIQSHTDMMPAKRQRRGRASTDEDPGTFPPLHCDMCQKYFPTPAEWVHHIQNTHTEFELRLSNKTSPTRSVRVNRPHVGPSHKICTVCDKKFPSHASMLIHRRTHTGEKPYMCDYCCKGFNVKSNLLRHLRTLHDRIINSTEVESKEIDSKEEPAAETPECSKFKNLS